MRGEKIHEQVSATPYTQFSDTSHITVNKRNILFLKNLHHMLIPHFTKLVHDNEDKVLVAKDGTGDVSLSQEDDCEEEINIEEAKKRIAMLEAIFGEENQEEQKELSSFIEGNETLH